MQGGHNLDEPVSTIMARVAGDVVMPRFRNLRADEVTEKSRGEIVTVADREAEHRLYDALAAIDPTARIVGEEACATNPDLLNGLGEGRIWIVDPIDGTSNYASGREPFGLIVALVEDGVTTAGWLYDPIAKRSCHAVAGGGAFINGKPVRVSVARRELPVATLATQFMAADAREQLHAAASSEFELLPIPRCAAAHYPWLVTGRYDMALFQRTLPWDHAAGALFLAEAGGCVTRWDGSAYRIDDGGVGIVAAASRAVWRTAMKVIRPGDLNVPLAS